MAIGKQQNASAPKRVSMAVGSFTKGGLIDDVDVEFSDVGTTLYDYNGTAAEGPSLAVQMTDEAGNVHDQYYSAGKIEDWMPDDNNEGFVAVSGKAGINTSSNLARFLQSLVEAGFPDERLAEGNLKCLIGLRCHVLQTVVERKGIVRKGANADRPSTVLLVSKIHELPGAAKSAKPVAKAPVKAAAAPAAQAPASSNGSGDLDDEISTVLMEHFASGNTSLAKKDVTKLIFTAFDPKTSGMSMKDRSARITRAGKEVFLTAFAEANGLEYDGATLTMAE